MAKGGKWSTGPKRSVTSSTSPEQRRQFDIMMDFYGFETDGALIKFALGELWHNEVKGSSDE